MSEPPTTSTEDKRLRGTMSATLWTALLFAASLPIAYWVWFSLINNVEAAKTDPSRWGSFGDFIGGILNPVVAFLALFWLTRSIAIQREELRDTKIALEKSYEAQRQQAITAEKQSFEDTFFALLDQHNKVLESLHHKEHLQNSRTTIELLHSHALGVGVKSLAVASERFKKLDELSGHYFRILYQLLKLISLNAPQTNLGPTFTGETLLATDPSPNEKLYSNIVRSFLSSSVTQLLAVNCYCPTKNTTYWNYKCLVERYAFLEHMPFEVQDQSHPALIETTSHYGRSAFGKSEFLPTSAPQA